MRSSCTAIFCRAVLLYYGILTMCGFVKCLQVILATGGGAYKFSDMASERLGVTLAKGDELSCLLKGLNFLLKHIPDECYYFDTPNSPDDCSTSVAYDMQVCITEVALR